jgi:hypothetical protein
MKVNCLQCILADSRKRSKKTEDKGLEHYLPKLRATGTAPFRQHIEHLKTEENTREPQPEEILRVSLNPTKQAYWSSDVGEFNNHCNFVRLAETSTETGIAVTGTVEAVVSLILGTNCGLYYSIQVESCADRKLRKVLYKLGQFAGEEFKEIAEFLMDQLGFLPLSYEHCGDRKLLRETKSLYESSKLAGKRVAFVFEPRDNSCYRVEFASQDDSDSDDE